MDLTSQIHHIFHPTSVAVIGASSNPQKPGYLCTSNLINDGFKGKIYPINPSISEFSGLKTYSTILDIPDEVDLAISVVPAEQAVSVLQDCVKKQVKGIVFVSAGFREIGSEIGSNLQNELKEIADNGGIKIIGPNTMGLINTKANLNATFSPGLGLSKTGNVSVVSQSGGMCVYLVNALADNNIGIGKVIGLGNRCNLDFDEMIAYLGQDKETDVIVLYIEGLDNPKKLIDVASKTGTKKPIIALKGGRSEESSTTTMSHTGSLAGKYEYYKAAFRQGRIISVDTLTELSDMTKALALQQPSRGKRLAVLSLQAGPGIIAADKAREYGMTLSTFSQETRKRLRENISPLLSIENPVDMAWTGSNIDTSREILDAVLKDENVDAVLVAFISFELSRELPKALIEVAAAARKPVVACVGSLGSAEDTVNGLEEAGIPTYPSPDRACTGLAGLVRYGEILKGITS
ncbi:MAG: CoA-binding protein [Dehalococcoidales bacterium]|nr:MAG: CoA-binding protein [Dehalococcoidales bacterium]